VAMPAAALRSASSSASPFDPIRENRNLHRLAVVEGR
jgi:hypothetical protein